MKFSGGVSLFENMRKNFKLYLVLVLVLVVKSKALSYHMHRLETLNIEGVV